MTLADTNLTTFTVSNSTEMTKAIKIHVREGKEGISVLSFNIFLGPNDIWAAGLIPNESNFPGHEGEESGRIVFADVSCTPFLNSGQEFLPYDIRSESADTDLTRSTEGYIEVLEMGELDPDSGLGRAARVNTSAGDCALIQAAYDGVGIWVEDEGGDLTTHLLPTTGGLNAKASIIDVAEGTLYPVEGLVFDNFYPVDTVFHTPPGDNYTPSMAQADNTSVLVSDDGQPLQTEWEFGYQAISALLTKKHIMSYYMLDPNVGGRTEVVFTFPTKRFYYDENGLPQLPFTERYLLNEGACEDSEIFARDRDSDDNFCLLYQEDPSCISVGSETLIFKFF